MHIPRVFSKEKCRDSTKRFLQASYLKKHCGDRRNLFKTLSFKMQDLKMHNMLVNSLHSDLNHRQIGSTSRVSGVQWHFTAVIRKIVCWRVLQNIRFKCSRRRRYIKRLVGCSWFFFYSSDWIQTVQDTASHNMGEQMSPYTERGQSLDVTFVQISLASGSRSSTGWGLHKVKRI